MKSLGLNESPCRRRAESYRYQPVTSLVGKCRLHNATKLSRSAYLNRHEGSNRKENILCESNTGITWSCSVSRSEPLVEDVAIARRRMRSFAPTEQIVGRRLRHRV